MYDIDQEYAISAYKNGVLIEIQSVVQTLTGAKREAEGWARDGCTQITIKQYVEGDLAHQWDLKDGKWVQYE